MNKPCSGTISYYSELYNKFNYDNLNKIIELELTFFKRMIQFLISLCLLISLPISELLKIILALLLEVIFFNT